MPSAASKQPAKGRPATAIKTTSAAPQVAADAYPSVDAAMAEVEELGRSDGLDDAQRLRRIEAWLNMQGGKIADDLAAKIKDPSVGLPTRITACRVLTRQGPVAIPTLLEASRGEPRQLRLKAIECLGRVKPTNAEVVSRLVLLLEDDDYDIRKGSLSSLAAIGPAVKEHDATIVEKLIAILNDGNEDETIRSLAKDALKKVDPRRGLMNAH
jgi:hypothetical protein